MRRSSDLDPDGLHPLGDGHLEEARPLPIRRARIVVDPEPELAPGDLIRAPIRFYPVPGPVVPGGFDTQFHAFFAGIGAYGSATGAIERIGEGEGWSAPVTVLRVSLADRPFVVDTIREYLASENLVIQRFIHPVLGVVRGPAGEVERVGDPGTGPREALVHCEMTQLADPDRRAALRAGVIARMADVVAATDDFGAMLDEVDRTAAAMRALAVRFPDRAAELDEIEEFLGWLRDHNFVFLGYRAYDLLRAGEEASLAVQPGSGLGILRDEARSAWAQPVALSTITDELRRRVVEGPTLIISKTNAEATVHRRARMDYIGVKKLDNEGRVVGERRFLGLFTSKAYAEHADVIPILRDKLEAILGRSGAPPGSHDYKEIITIFNSLPKEELFQASVDELLVEVQTVLSFLFADQVQVALRPDPLGRGVSVMVILPRGRFSGEVRQRIQEAIWSGQLVPGAHLVETTLADGFQISRGPLREALRTLAAEGLVEYRPGRGAFVIDPTLDQMQDYDGRVGDIDVDLYRGAYAIEQVRVVQTTGTVPVPLFEAERVDLSVEWSALLRGKIVGQIVMQSPVLNFVDAGDDEAPPGQAMPVGDMPLEEPHTPHQQDNETALAVDGDSNRSNP